MQDLLLLLALDSDRIQSIIVAFMTRDRVQFLNLVQRTITLESLDYHNFDRRLLRPRLPR